MRSSLRSGAFFCAILVALAHPVFAQGPLVPPGAPGKTMKSLDQVEPRQDLLLLPGDATSQVIVSQPGSYFLSANLTGVSGKNGISINTSNVTIDLRGFSVLGIAGSMSGVICTSGTSQIRIQNGKLVSWPKSGADMSGSTGVQIQQIDASGNHDAGILTGDDSVIQDCTVRSNVDNGISTGYKNKVINCIANGNGYGMILFDGSQAEGCQASGNTTGGVLFTANCRISHCAAHQNTGMGFGPANSPVGCSLSDCVASGNAGFGFVVYEHTTLVACTATGNGSGFLGTGPASTGNAFIQCLASGNTGTSPNGYGFTCGIGAKVEGCTAENNNGIGILGGQGSSITGCEVKGNKLDGIRVANDAYVARNHVSANGDASHLSAGIRATSDGNRIVDNSIVFNSDTGLQVDGASNLITGNSSRFQTTKNFVIAAGNHYGQIVDLTSTSGLAAVGSNAAAATLGGVSSALANFAY
jgi:hypothetical protein